MRAAAMTSFVFMCKIIHHFSIFQDVFRPCVRPFLDHFKFQYILLIRITYETLVFYVISKLFSFIDFI